MSESVSVPRDLLVDHVVSEAMEFGEITLSASAPGGGDGLDWSLHGIDNWDVDIDGEVIVLSAIMTGYYDRMVRPAKINPPGAAHPAEYETHETELMIEIRADWSEHDGLGRYEIRTEVA